MRLRIWIISILSLLSVLSSFAIENRREFKVINASNGLADNSAQTVVCTKTGRIIISTLGNLNFYDGTSFTHIDTRQKYDYQLPLYRGSDQLCFDRKHHLWMKKFGVVTCVDLLQEVFIEDVAGVLRNDFSMEDPILDLFVDSSGTLWFLTEKGLCNADTKRSYSTLRDRNLQDLELVDSALFLFYDDGEEVCCDVRTGNVLHRTKAYEWDEAQKYLSTSALKRYGDGFYQIRNGEQESVLLHFDLKTLQWSKVMTLDYAMNALSFYNDRLYLATDVGYWVCDLKTGEQQHIEALKLKGGRTPLRTVCNTVTFDRQGGLWIGTDRRGLLYARPVASPFKVFDLADPAAQKYQSELRGLESFVGEFRGMKTNTKYEDSRGWTWFGTTDGLYMYRSPKTEPVVFNKKNGLLNNVIHSIVEDQGHNIWVSTSCGISCILFEGEKVIFVNSFAEDDNVPNESFINGKAACLEDGMIVMQSIDHLTAFYPSDFEYSNGRNPIGLYPKLIKMLVNGNYVEPGGVMDDHVIIDRAITRVRDISLNANQNSISLTFSGLNYFRPIQTYYRVRVKGLDEEWKVLSYYNSNGMVDRRGMLHLPLVSLKPGVYEVEVQASMLPDVWSNAPLSWVIHVNQPWWQTTGVYALIIVLLLAMSIVNFVYYSRNTKMRAKLNSGEGDLIRKICSFVERTEAIVNSSYIRTNDDATDAKENMLSKEFLEVMMKVIPYVSQHKNGRLTMHRLSLVGGMDVAQFYDVMTTHLYRNPRFMARYILLQRAGELLRTTDMTVEEIAHECRFSSPNYFMGNFFHEYKMTPGEYRREHQE